MTRPSVRSRIRHAGALSLVLPLCAALTGCFGEEAEPSESTQNAQGDRYSAGVKSGECKKIEGGAIGKNGVTVDLGSGTVTVTSWTRKQDGGDYVGFTLEGADVTFRVKSGQDIHEGAGTSWQNPNGTKGPAAKGISNIIFCPNPPEGGDGPGAPGEPGTPGDPGCIDDVCGGDGPGGSTPGEPSTPGDSDCDDDVGCGGYSPPGSGGGYIED